ncbi:hypothetical protein LTS18_011567, partial [Coniosporium uncinatum]
PRKFDPDRFVDDYQSSADAAANPDVSKRDHFTFGAGRRICQGMHIADRSLFLGMARMLWAFDFKPEKDQHGNDVMPDTEELTQGFVCRNVDFKARITPRSEKRAEMVRREWKEVMEGCLDAESKQWRVSPL